MRGLPQDGLIRIDRVSGRNQFLNTKLNSPHPLPKFQSLGGRKPFLTYLTFIIHARERKKGFDISSSPSSSSAGSLCAPTYDVGNASDDERRRHANVNGDVSRPLNSGPRDGYVYRELHLEEPGRRGWHGWTPARLRMTWVSGYFSGILATH